jgi:hypothetical protein
MESIPAAKEQLQGTSTARAIVIPIFTSPELTDFNAIRPM